MANLVIEITVPVASHDVIGVSMTIAQFEEELNGLLEALPEGSAHTSKLVEKRADAGKPRGRKPKAAAPNGAEGQYCTSRTQRHEDAL